MPPENALLTLIEKLQQQFAVMQRQMVDGYEINKKAIDTAFAALNMLRALTEHHSAQITAIEKEIATIKEAMASKTRH